MTYRTYKTKAEANAAVAAERANGRRAYVTTYSASRHEVRSWG